MKKLLLFLSVFYGSYIFACPEVLDHELRVLDSSETVNLCKYENKVVLAVNVASRCGYTPQYNDLQKLWTEYKKKDVVVLGIPTNNFKQEPGSNSEIKEFCETNFEGS